MPFASIEISSLTEIQSGQFIPDATRSGYLPELLPAQDTTLNSTTFGSFPLVNPEDEHVPLDGSHVDNMPTDDTKLETPTKTTDDAILEVSAAPNNVSDEYDSSSTSSSGSSSSSISDNEVDIVPDFPQDIGGNCFPHVEKFLPVKHRQTHRLHLLVNAEHTRLICGRALSQTYERLDRFPSHPLPTCVQCFASKIVGSFDEC